MVQAFLFLSTNGINLDHPFFFTNNRQHLIVFKSLLKSQRFRYFIVEEELHGMNLTFQEVQIISLWIWVSMASFDLIP